MRELQVGSTSIYVGELHLGKEKLYTAWWLSNGTHHTIDQRDWRWRMLRGERGFNLVNATVAREADLLPVVERLLEAY